MYENECNQQNKEPGVIYTQYLIDEVLQNAPQIDQVDRGLSVNEEEEVKNQKSIKWCCY